tara:strand:+ start:255 stop:593 length:339 start_codon:yes stop_codon:yes gene_type:complete
MNEDEKKIYFYKEGYVDISHANILSLRGKTVVGGDNPTLPSSIQRDHPMVASLIHLDQNTEERRGVMYVPFKHHDKVLNEIINNMLTETQKNQLCLMIKEKGLEDWTDVTVE